MVLLWREGPASLSKGNQYVLASSTVLKEGVEIISIIKRLVRCSGGQNSRTGESKAFAYDHADE